MPRAAGFCVFHTPIGPCAIAWTDDARIVGIQLPEGTDSATLARMKRRFVGVPEAAPLPAIESVIKRILALLQGEPDPLLDIPLDMSQVSQFEQRVYEITRSIPPGRTLTYGEVAAQIGEPGAARAVGQALGHNPFAPVVPCHRVLAAGSGAGGFSAGGGVATKLRMLQIEKAQFGPQPGLFD